MTDDTPKKIYAVEHVAGVARPFKIGDPVRVYEGVVANDIVTVSADTWGAPGSAREDLDERRAIANRDLPAALHRLDALADPVSRAVLDLHRRAPRFGTEWECSHCLEASDMGDNYAWPCDTVETVASVHGIGLTDFWLLRRPEDGSLDQPPSTPETT